MTVDTVIRGGTVVSPTGTRVASIAIEGEQIVAVGAEAQLPAAETSVDAAGKLVLPGVVDPHVHIDEVPANRAGTVPAETAAAARGGVTTFIDFAFQGGDRRIADESKDLLDGIAHKRSKEDQAYVDYSLHGVLNRERQETLEQLAPAIDRGVTSFKMFMSNYEVGVSTGFMIEAFERLAELDAVAALHTEDPSMCDALTAKLQRQGRGDAPAYPDSRPDYSEAAAAETAVRAAVEHDVKYYGVHTTCRDAAAAIDRHQDDQSTVRAETCTHYTVLDRSVYETQGNLPVLAPPLRTADDQDALFEHLGDRTLTVVSTDHSVYHEEYKHTENWWDAPFGVNSLQYSLPVFYEEAIIERGHSLPFLVRLMCTNPAQTFGLPQKGTLDPGTDADIVILDPTADDVISAADNASNATFSIYEGRDVSVSVEQTFVRGQRVVDDGGVVAETGTGQFIERTLPDWEQ